MSNVSGASNSRTVVTASKWIALALVLVALLHVWFELTVSTHTLLGMDGSDDDQPPAVGQQLAAGDAAADRWTVRCTARDSILFLKTHKCASTTVQNILMRYGERRGLDFVISDDGNYVGSPQHFTSRYIPATLWPHSGRFHMFCHHTRLDVDEVKAILQPDAAWVTILRDPIDQFESLFQYYDFGATSRWNMTLQKFASLPLADKRKLRRIGKGRYGGNQIAFDLGFDPAIAEDPELVRKMVQKVEQQFDLVMISEMLDESLVLLQRLMCWTTDDVLYISRNTRRDEFRTRLTQRETAQIRDYLVLDNALYQHFRRRLGEKISAVSTRQVVLQAEQLADLRTRTKHRCISEPSQERDQDPFSREYSEQVKGYVLNDPHDWNCSRMMLPEMQYTDLLREQQRERNAIWRRVYRLLGESYQL